MTKEQQRIAIAQWMGWKLSVPIFTHAGKWVQYFSKNPSTDKSISSWAGKPHDVEIQTESVPAYPEDLNAMHEAEKKLRLPNGCMPTEWYLQLRKASQDNEECATAS